MKRFAVIGKPIEHSLSPFIHQSFGKQLGIELTYEKIEGDEQGFEQQVGEFFSQNGKGLNVTQPFKQRAFAMAHQHTLRCRKAEAANTLWMQEGTLWADNTDGIGLIRALKPYLSVYHKTILIVGAGGASRGIIPPLLDNWPLQLVVANRSQDTLKRLIRDFPRVIGVELSQLSGAFDLLINATSSSLKGESLDLPRDCFKTKPFCCDLAYNQTAPTPFVAYAKTLGCEAIDGLGMLVEQAAEAFCVWNGIMPDVKPVLNALTTRT